MNVVLDTNVVASAIFFGGKPKKVIEMLMAGQIEAFASKEILEEYSDTVEYLYDKYPGRKPKTPFGQIAAKCKVVKTHSLIDICRDPDDNKFIECAMDASCYYVVSGDKDLLTIKEYEGIHIVTVSEFLDIMENL